jgi:hypothetical protein
MVDMKETTRELDNEFKKVWESEPEEIRTLKKMTGAFGATGPLLLYVESETRELVEYLWIVKTMMKEGRASHDAGKSMFQEILRFKARKFINWYRMHHTAKLMQYAADSLDNATSQDDILNVIDALSRYLSKWNFRLDHTIPWAAIAFVYDASLGKH